MHALRLRALCAVLIAASTASANASPDGEELFADLRHQVDVRRPQQALGTLDRIAKATANLTECPLDAVYPAADGKLRTKLAFGQGSVQHYNALYTYADIYFGDDYCIYMLRPIRKALTLEEARDFVSSLMIEIPRTDYLIPHETPESRAAAARTFDELREAVHSGKAKPTDPNIPPYAGMENLTDCSNTPVQTLRDAPRGGTTAFIYNGAYSWGEVEVNGRSCIYLERPLNRGLTVDEARDFLAATRLGMGLLEPPHHEKKEGEDDPSEWIQAEPGAHPAVPLWASKDDYPFEITIGPENESSPQKKRAKEPKPL